MNERHIGLGELAVGALTCGWEDSHRSRITSSESAETMRKQKQRGDLRGMAGSIQAEEKKAESSVWGIPKLLPSMGDQGIQSPKLPWVLSILELLFFFFGHREACHHGPYCFVYLYSKPLICEVTGGSLFLSAAELNVYAGDWKSVGVVG